LFLLTKGQLTYVGNKLGNLEKRTAYTPSH
jgi:hypothetical protein